MSDYKLCSFSFGAHSAFFKTHGFMKPINLIRVIIIVKPMRLVKFNIKPSYLGTKFNKACLVPIWNNLKFYVGANDNNTLIAFRHVSRACVPL